MEIIIRRFRTSLSINPVTRQKRREQDAGQERTQGCADLSRWSAPPAGTATGRHSFQAAGDRAFGWAKTPVEVVPKLHEERGENSTRRRNAIEIARAPQCENTVRDGAKLPLGPRNPALSCAERVVRRPQALANLCRVAAARNAGRATRIITKHTSARMPSKLVQAAKRQMGASKTVKLLVIAFDA